MSTSICQSNLTSGFIDLATYDELEKYMYGGADAIAYFVRETRKSTWFTQVPVQLAKCEGIADFGQDWSVSISRSGDYLLGTWLHVALPAVSVAGWNGRSVCIAWTPNLMHALVKSCCVSFNDLVAAKFDGTHLDFWAAFTTPAAKADGYRHMIGSQIPSCGGFIPAQTCDLPLPFFYTRDSGVALPTAALPYNEMRISFSFRGWDELLVGFAPKIDCYNYAVADPAKKIENSSLSTPYIIPSYNTSANGVQPSWNSDIWPTCFAPTAAGDGDGPNILASTSVTANQMHTEFQNSDEMSFIILPKLPGPPMAHLTASGQNQVTQTPDKTNFLMKDAFPYYVGEPVNKGANGIFCDIKELSLRCQVWANYAIVSNEERKKMSCAPRDMLIEQVQSTPPIDFDIRTQPDSRWWPNNISKLVGGGNKLPSVSQAPEGTAPGAAGSSFIASNDAVPDNDVPSGEQNWPAHTVNFLPQQPSQEGWCLSSHARTDHAPTGLQGAVENLKATTGVLYDGKPTHDSTRWTVAEGDIGRAVTCESTSATVSLNLKYAYTVKALFFAVKNVTASNIHSNYTIGFPVLQAAATSQVTLDGPVFAKSTWDDTIGYKWNGNTATSGGSDGDGTAPSRPPPHYRPSQSGGIAKYVGKIQTLIQQVITCKNGYDPIERASVLYETTPRLGLLDSSYYSLTQPYYHAPTIPSAEGAVFCPTGYHMYSYSLEFMALDPLGSTNYGKLTNVSIDAEPIKLDSSNMCPELSYAVPAVNQGDGIANSRYVFGPINAPGIVGDDASGLKNQSVLEVLINMAYQNIYSEQGLETISPAVAASANSAARTSCTFLGKYKFVSTAINNNILRISGGSIGFPVL